MDTPMQLGPFDQEPYVADKDNPWKRRDLLGWRRTRAYAQIRQLPPLHVKMPGVPTMAVPRSVVPWKIHDDDDNPWPVPTTLLGCRLAASLTEIGINAKQAAEPLVPASVTEGDPKRSRPSVWDECQRQAIAILESDHARFGESKKTPEQVWRFLQIPAAEAEHESSVNSEPNLAGEPVPASGIGDSSGLVESAWSRSAVMTLLREERLVNAVWFVFWVAAGIVLGSIKMIPPAIVEWATAFPVFHVCLVAIVVTQLLTRWLFRVARLGNRRGRSISWAGRSLFYILAPVLSLAIGGILAKGSVGFPAALTAGAMGVAGAFVLAFISGRPVHSQVSHLVVLASVGYAITVAAFGLFSPAGSVVMAVIATAVAVWLIPRGVALSITDGYGIVGFWYMGMPGGGWETRVSRYLRADAEMWLDDRLHLAVTGAMGAVLGAEGRLPIPASPRLVEVDGVALVPTDAMERVLADLGEHRTAAVAVVGERGLGKTTVVEAVQKRCDLISKAVELDDGLAVPNVAGTVRLIVPGDYSAPDFVSYVAREISEGVAMQVERVQFRGWIGTSLPWYLLAHLAIMLMFMEIVDRGGGWTPWVAASPGVVVFLFSVLAGPVALVFARGAIRFRHAVVRGERQWHALVEKQLHARRAVLMEARNLGHDLTWLRRLSTGVSAGVSIGSDEKSHRLLSHLPGGALGVQRAEEQTALTLTYAEIVRRTRKVLELYSNWAETFAETYQRQAGNVSLGASMKIRRELGNNFSDITREVYENMVPSLIVMVDELDKIPPDERTTAVNHIKDLFRIPHVKFVVTIADDYDDYRFMRYGVPLRGRDPYDSAFDDIVQVQACDPLTAMQLFTRRVRGFPAPLALLAFVLAAGHPRDMIRAARFSLDWFRQATERLGAEGLAVSEVRARALAEAIEAACTRENDEFVALVRSVEFPDRQPSRPWDMGVTDQAAGHLSPAGAAAVQRMKDLLDGAESFVRNYASDPAKGWATPDLAPDTQDTAAPPDAPWRAYPVCRDAAELASERLKVVEQVRALAVARQSAGGTSAARPARSRRLRGAR